MLTDKRPIIGPDPTYRVLLVAPSPPPYGGMALQSRLLEKLLREDGNAVVFFPANFPFRAWLRPLAKVPGLRTFIRAVLIWVKLWEPVRQAEIVHVFAASWLYFFLAVSPAVVVGRLRGKKVILNYRGGEAPQFFRWWGWATKPIFKLATSVTAPSEFLADVIRNRFRVPVQIVSNILDVSAFRFRERTELRPKLLVTRHLEKIYDIQSVLEAFRTVQGHRPEATLWIAGSGSQEEHLRNLVSRWNLKNVRFLGHVAHADLPSICDHCDVLLNGSRVDNFPGALLEASAAGLVVVSTCAGGIPFIYQNGKSALLVEPGDSAGLAQSVEKLLERPALALALAKEAAAVARRCDWKEVRQSLYRSYGGPGTVETPSYVSVDPISSEGA